MHGLQSFIYGATTQTYAGMDFPRPLQRVAVSPIQIASRQFVASQHHA